MKIKVCAFIDRLSCTLRIMKIYLIPTTLNLFNSWQREHKKLNRRLMFLSSFCLEFLSRVWVSSLKLLGFVDKFTLAAHFRRSWKNTVCRRGDKGGAKNIRPPSWRKRRRSLIFWHSRFLLRLVYLVRSVLPSLVLPLILKKIKFSSFAVWNKIKSYAANVVVFIHVCKGQTPKYFAQWAEVNRLYHLYLNIVIKSVS